MANDTNLNRVEIKNITSDEKKALKELKKILLQKTASGVLRFILKDYLTVRMELIRVKEMHYKRAQELKTILERREAISRAEKELESYYNKIELTEILF